MKAYKHLNENDFPLEEGEGSNPNDPDNWVSAFFGYTLVSISLGQMFTMFGLNSYFQKYFETVSKAQTASKAPKMIPFSPEASIFGQDGSGSASGIQLHSELLPEIFFVTMFLCILPATFLMKKDSSRLYLLAVLVLSLSLLVMTPGILINNYFLHSVLFGVIGGVSQSAVSIFPMLKIRDYIVRFERKILATGVFFAIASACQLLSCNIVMGWLASDPEVARGVMDIDAMDVKMRWFSGGIFVPGFLGILLIWISERDNRFVGMDDSGSAVYFDENDLAEGYEIDAESKPNDDILLFFEFIWILLSVLKTPKKLIPGLKIVFILVSRRYFSQ